MQVIDLAGLPRVYPSAVRHGARSRSIDRFPVERLETGRLPYRVHRQSVAADRVCAQHARAERAARAIDPRHGIWVRSARGWRIRRAIWSGGCRATKKPRDGAALGWAGLVTLNPAVDR